MTSFVNKTEDEIKAFLDEIVQNAVNTAMTTAVADIKQEFHDELVNILGQPEVSVISDIIGHTDNVGAGLSNDITGLNNGFQNLLNQALAPITNILGRIPGL